MSVKEANAECTKTSSGGASWTDCEQTNPDSRPYWSAGSDGLVYSFTRCTFTECSVSGNGGALWFSASKDTDTNIYHYYTVIIDDCTFTGCNATNGAGGAVCAAYLNNATILSSTFSNCNSTDQGGSVWLSRGIESYPLQLTVDDCTFTNSKSGIEISRAGGAIFARWLTYASIKHSNFYNCSAGSYGGSFYLSSESDKLSLTLTIDSCSFTNNIAKNHDGGAVGAWYVTAAEIKNSQFSNCSAQLNGGSVFLSHNPDDNSDLYIEPKLTVNSYSFKNGTIKGNSRGVRKQSSYLSIIISNSIFTKCEVTSSGYGGAVCAYYIHIATITHSIFTNCNSSVDGGAVYLRRETTDHPLSLSVDNCVFNETHASTASNMWGGAICAIYLNSAEITHTSFTSCSAGGPGGALYLNPYNAALNLNLSIDNCFFNDSKSNNYGGAVWAQYITTADIKNSKFETCSAAGYGGSLWLNPSIDNLTFALTVDSCSFKDSAASNSGGAIGAYYISTAEIRNSDFSGCSAKNYGGSIYFNPNTLTLSTNLYVHGCNFLNSAANSSHGGAIYAERVSDSSMTNSTFHECTAKQDGGALYLSRMSNPKLTLTDLLFTDNTANAKADDIYLSTDTGVTITNSYILPCGDKTSNLETVANQLLCMDSPKWTFTKSSSTSGVMQCAEPNKAACSIITEAVIVAKHEEASDYFHSLHSPHNLH